MVKYGIFAPLGAGMLANAYAESKLDPNAVGDGGESVGIWQIRDTGGVAPYLSDLSERSDPYASTVAMIRFMENHRGPTIPGAAGPVPIADPMTLVASGEKSITEYTVSFMQHVERPSWSQSGQDRRIDIARQMFPIIGIF